MAERPTAPRQILEEPTQAYVLNRLEQQYACNPPKANGAPSYSQAELRRQIASGKPEGEFPVTDAEKEFFERLASLNDDEITPDLLDEALRWYGFGPIENNSKKFT